MAIFDAVGGCHRLRVVRPVRQATTTTIRRRRILHPSERRDKQRGLSRLVIKWLQSAAARNQDFSLLFSANGLDSAESLRTRASTHAPSEAASEAKLKARIRHCWSRWLPPFRASARVYYHYCFIRPSPDQAPPVSSTKAAGRW